MATCIHHFLAVHQAVAVAGLEIVLRRPGLDDVEAFELDPTKKGSADHQLDFRPPRQIAEELSRRTLFPLLARPVRR